MAEAKRRQATARLALILAAYPSRASAARSARALVRKGTLACATVAPGSTAFFRWEGKFHETASVLLWGKTTRRNSAAAAKAIAASHPDRVPEILTIEIAGAQPAYASWVAASTPAFVAPAASRGARARRARSAR